MRYYIADCHFFHGKLNTKMDQRGFESPEEMNEYMLEKLHGRLYLILGNHDRFLTNKGYNCFCMYSDYTPLTLDEWIECDGKRK